MIDDPGLHVKQAKNAEIIGSQILRSRPESSRKTFPVALVYALCLPRLFVYNHPESACFVFEAVLPLSVTSSVTSKTPVEAYTTVGYFSVLVEGVPPGKLQR